jgi:hypothetical protein
VDRLWLERFARKERAYWHCQPAAIGSMLKALTSRKADSNGVLSESPKPAAAGERNGQSCYESN